MRVLEHRAYSTLAQHKLEFHRKRIAILSVIVISSYPLWLPFADRVVCLVNSDRALVTHSPIGFYTPSVVHQALLPLVQHLDSVWPHCAIGHLRWQPSCLVD